MNVLSYRAPVHMFQSVMCTPSLYYFWKCCVFRNAVYNVREVHSKAKPFLCAAFVVGLAPCATCCITCKLKFISQFVHLYELVTVSVLQVNVGSLKLKGILGHQQCSWLHWCMKLVKVRSKCSVLTELLGSC